MRKGLLFCVTVAVWLGTSIAWAREPLTFEERVKAQEAIERVYYEHRIWPQENPGPKPSFNEAFPRAVLEAKVTEYLKKSAALDLFWRRPITPDQLQAEVDRMARDTQDPEALAALFHALDDEPSLIAECLARPLLSDRLIRNWFASDLDFQPPVEEWASALAQSLENGGELPRMQGESRTVRAMRTRLEAASPFEVQNDGGILELSPSDYDRLVARFPSTTAHPAIEESDEQVAVMTTQVMTQDRFEGTVYLFHKVPFSEWWPKASSLVAPQLPATDEGYVLPRLLSSGTFAEPPSPNSWQALWYAPQPRYYHATVWTGTEMIVWGGGGFADANPLNTGGRYTPSTDTWQPTSTGTNCPVARTGCTGVWTGTQMVVWGGSDGTSPLNSGGRYSPTTDTWSTTSTGGSCPAARTSHTAVWTGNLMVIWGGTTSSANLNTGGRYNPTSDAWSTTSTGTNCPAGRGQHTAVWTGSEMIVWGGYVSYFPGGAPVNTGGRFNPSTNSWLTVSTGTNCPTARSAHSAVWTSTEMIVWGGIGSGNFQTGARYVPSSDTWSPTSTTSPCPSGRGNHVAVWTGAEMIIWGGGSYLNSGGKYTPSTNSWVATSTVGACPSVRSNATAVWTGSEMIVWGGRYQNRRLSTGGRYLPASDSWTPTSPGASCPSVRWGNTAVWTGSEMVIWGGTWWDYFNTGGRYSPAVDTWTATSSGAGCPAARSNHTAAWTGTEMIVWGGGGQGGRVNSGGRYSPVSDTWTPTSTGTGCPAARERHTAVWTGSEMIVWGGELSATPGWTDSGGRYNPSVDSWTPTSTGSNCPHARGYHTAVWAGTEMIVWGGYWSDTGTYYENTGGRYNPVSDSWTATSTGTNCPEGRWLGTAIWTGTEMIVWGGETPILGTLNSGGRYSPSSDSWEATSKGANCPSARTRHSAVWTGTEMIVWGGEIAYQVYANNGGRYMPTADAWAPTPTSGGCPSGRNQHTAVWTGGSMIVWGGNLDPQNGGIYYPNTPPRSVPVLSTSFGGDAIYTLGLGETLLLEGALSTDGSNANSTPPYHDGGDSIVAYEWDLNGDAQLGTNCAGSASGIDRTGVAPSSLTESDLGAFGINSPGTYTIWLRVTDEAGLKTCGSAQLSVVSAPTATGEASRGGTLMASRNGALLHVDYAGACNATGHTLYWGDLGQIASYGWTGSYCTTGASAIELNLPAGNSYFVVVGNNGTSEGSYGTATGGAQRPEAVGVGTCDWPQVLVGSCDP